MQQEESVGQAVRTSLHGHWSSRMAFILAVTGSAVGLGNIWKFPYVAGENGGGAFVLVYALCVFLIGLPVMMSEILIGRRGRRNPVATMALLGEEEGHSRRWKWIGGAAVVAGLLILTYYSVVAGWTLVYIKLAAGGAFVGASAGRIRDLFDIFTADWLQVAVAHTAFMAITVFVVARGVERGLERAVRFFVPALVVLLLVLLVSSIRSGGFAQGSGFLFNLDFAALTWNAVLIAMGQAFFTLSLGMGALMAYGAYLPDETSIVGASVTVVIADTAIAVLAGLIIFPVVFANGLDPADGPGLMFDTLPIAFGQMTGGVFFATVFFLLLAFAAWTSAIGLMEPSVAWLVEQHHRTRRQAALLVGGLIWLLGLGTVFSFNELREFTYWRGTIYDNLEFVTSNVMLPLAGMMITIFAAWVMCRNSTADELGGAGNAYRAWRFLASYVAPAAILLIFLRGIGVLG